MAVSRSRPHSAPAWVTAWWRHAIPDSSEPLAVALHDRDSLVGILPLVRVGGDLSLAGGDLFSAEPLAPAGREQEAATAFAAALEALVGRRVLFTVELRDDSPNWPPLLAGSWPGEPRRCEVDATTPLPRLRLGNSTFDQWFESRSANFRKDCRRKARRLEQEGAVLRNATAASLRGDVASLMRLHRGRHPNGTSLGAPGVSEMVAEVAAAGVDSGRIRLVCLESDGEVAAALLLTGAGSELCAWSGGHDDSLARHSPMMQCFLFALREMTERGEECLDLGPGAQPYKMRLASEEGSLTSWVLLPRGPGYAVARARLSLRRARRSLRDHSRRAGSVAKRALGGWSQ